jgi:hypothetical protein
MLLTVPSSSVFTAPQANVASHMADRVDVSNMVVFSRAVATGLSSAKTSVGRESKLEKGKRRKGKKQKGG